MNSFDVIVVGAGHAGIEAALAAARMGRRTACVTLRKDRIGHLPCNCSIGGPAKGHISREVDALGGQMAITTDYTLTHLRRVGTGKGPAVQTVRAHVCKTEYPLFMQSVFEQTPNLRVFEALAETVLTDPSGSHVIGVRISNLSRTETMDLSAPAVILTTGTFLNGLCHQGSEMTVAARHGDQAVQGLSTFLSEIGIPLKRFKTGTTPRIRFSSIDTSGLEVMDSEPEAGALSFLHDQPMPKSDLLGCWQTRTVVETHGILAEHLHESAMFSGQIQGVGPRYCPSIEDKIVRFADKDSHPIFLEIEEWSGESVYVQGFSTSLPAEAQLRALRSIPGLSNVEVLRYGYAVEYDMADPTYLLPTLMSKQLHGLFLAGQLNGTSGYEEAAGQGIVAGINAARLASDDEPILFDRAQSFIGVMIDDLVTKGVEDPYRMLTARAEHRLLLRHDNADQRLTPISREVGLCSDTRWNRFNTKVREIQTGETHLKGVFFTHRQNELLTASGQPEVNNRASMFELMRRPNASLSLIEELAIKAELITDDQVISSREVRDQLELMAKYDGYLQQQDRVASQARKLDHVRIPPQFEYENLVSLSYESREKLTRIRPVTIGQASRIPGVRPSDIALLIGHLKHRTRALDEVPSKQPNLPTES